MSGCPARGGTRHARQLLSRLLPPMPPHVGRGMPTSLQSYPTQLQYLFKIHFLTEEKKKKVHRVLGLECYNPCGLRNELSFCVWFFFVNIADVCFLPGGPKAFQQRLQMGGERALRAGLSCGCIFSVETASKFFLKKSSDCQFTSNEKCSVLDSPGGGFHRLFVSP